MKIYQVGGSLRDEMLGLAGADRDWVVVGATPEEMVKAGFRPVGRDFPVFLHPRTHEEYALARTERKTAPGYAGFVFHAAPEVTLEEDLIRRDFTVNAMAREDGRADAPLVDLFGGARDLRERVLRHVGPAFAEDPVRILRGARLAARLGFAIAPETMALMRAMVDSGEVDALVAERVWQELARGLVAGDPVTMFAVLSESGALARLAPELCPWSADGAAMAALRAAVRRGLDLAGRFAAMLAHLAPPAVDAMCARLRVPGEARDLALVHARHAAALREADRLDAGALAALVKSADGLRAPDRFRAMVDVAGAVAEGAGDPERSAWDGKARRLLAALKAVRGVDAGAVARTAGSPREIQEALAQARTAAIARALGAGEP